MTTRGRIRRWQPVVAVAAVLLAVAGWRLPGYDGDAAPAPTPQTVPVVHAAPQQVVSGATLRARPGPCDDPATGPFVPTRITIPGITRDSAVIALPRDRYNIPSPLPLTETAKHQFAWDRQPSPMPGADAGNVLLNTHTWPWTSAPAMGNLLLEHLRAGDRIIVGGVRTHLCYRVTRQVEIRAEQPYDAYYATDGPPQLAIMVCSGGRRGPGDWANRMIWFASPEA
ncbi:MAG: class F sortase [Marmoricola sp.]